MANTQFCRNRAVAALFASTLALGSPAVLAQDDATQIEVDEAGVMTDPSTGSVPRYGAFGISVGTGGYGIDYAYPLHRFFDLRAGFDFGSFSTDQDEDGIDYEAELKFSSARLLIDYKPFTGGFRISAGLYTGSPELDLEGNGNEEEAEIGNGLYNIAGRIVGDADLGGAAPYLGIGWGGTAGTTGFGMSFDLGVLFTDAPEISLAVPSGFACDANANPGCDPNDANGDRFDVNDPNNQEAQLFRDEIENERRNLEEDAEDFDLWPIIRLGLHYRF